MPDIRLKGVVMEDFVNYKVPSMFLITCQCDWKCCREAHCDVSLCQNEPMAMQPEKTFNVELIYKAFINNDISQSIVIGGLEPFLQFDEIYNLIYYFRAHQCFDTFVIYTGYYPNEIQQYLDKLKLLGNIIVKFGRYIPNQASKYDNVLGVTLASDNQYAEVISE